jgi:hypothetical protein
MRRCMLMSEKIFEAHRIRKVMTLINEPTLVIETQNQTQQNRRFLCHYCTQRSLYQ